MKYFLNIYEILIENKFILIGVFLFFLVELLTKRNLYNKFANKDIKTNFIFYFINELTIWRPISFFLSSIFYIYFFNRYSGMIDQFAYLKNLTGVFGFIIVLLISDFLQFHVHLLFHNNKYLWEFHKVHHSAQYLNVFSDWRTHILEYIVFMIFTEVPLLILGAPTEFIIYKGLFFQFMSIFLHMDIKYNFPLLSKFFPTPHLHLWHHAYEKIPLRSQQNIGSLFNIWDRIYGLYYYNDKYPEKLGFEGIAEFPTHSALLQLINPIKASIKYIKK